MLEVISTTDREPATRRKLVLYAEAVPLVWLVRPRRQTVEVYEPDQPVEIAPLDGILSGGTVLPGFSLAVRDISLNSPLLSQGNALAEASSHNLKLNGKPASRFWLDTTIFA